MRYLLLFLILPLAACSSYGPGMRRGGDTYKDLQALRAANTEGLDYSREFYYRGGPVAVFAPHGGDIELGTSRLARLTAGKDFNLYIFNGWLGGDSGRLHVTSSHFNDPDAVFIATSSLLGVSFHAQADRGSWVCVGGANKRAAELVVRRLENAGFAAETPCARLPGTAAANIVNRPSAGGVQLEITLRLLAALEKSAEELSKFTEAVRLAALEFVSSGQAKAATEETSK
ncbi:MAG: poly-gamma-glutamate hydrolase family protein [Elusimicrobiales bacterium]|nr:poly-gamma-glutamate hydrolase family protein [Elusimicrobiales bacterium]